MFEQLSIGGVPKNNFYYNDAYAKLGKWIGKEPEHLVNNVNDLENDINNLIEHWEKEYSLRLTYQDKMYVKGVKLVPKDSKNIEIQIVGGY